MPRYLVARDQPEDDFASSAEVIQAADAQHAAEVFVVRYHEDLGAPSDLDVRVREPGGMISRWAVVVALMPRAWATALNGGPKR